MPDEGEAGALPSYLRIAERLTREIGGGRLVPGERLPPERQMAAENGVALHSDPPTARALHAGVEIGEEVRPEHYQAVAAAIRFAEEMRKKARRW